MKIELTSRAVRTGTTVRFVTPDAPKPLPSGEFGGEFLKTARLNSPDELLVGLGPASKIEADTLRSAAAVAVSKLKQLRIEEATFALSSWEKHAGAIVEGAILAEYQFHEFKRSKASALQRLRLHSTKSASLRATVRKSRLIAEAVNYARRINNQPGNVIYPETLAAEARKLASRAKLKVSVFDVARLKRLGMAGLLAVGRGSQQPPRLIMLEYRPRGSRKPPLVLVGKAITFDTGGISIKSRDNMQEMVFDKSGGTSVLGAMSALSALGVSRPVVGLIPSAENMPGPDAYRPGDIIRMFDGTCVEVVNTDAEGRMVLADAIAYARSVLKADRIIDLATLTGACGVALGRYTAGLWTNSEALAKSVNNAAAQAAEPVWRMPLTEEWDDEIKSKVADIKNCGGRLGGASSAAAFLKHFAGTTPWVHLDIAYPAAQSESRRGLAAGATGFGIRTLLQLIEDLA